MRFASSEFCDLFIYHKSNTFYETTQILNSSSFDGNLPKKLNVVSFVHGVLGASVFNVVYLLSTGFTRLILIAVVIAVPVAWFAVNSWLKSFAFRVNADWVIFLTASLAALAIAWITVSYESVKAAIANPVKSLRTE